MASPSLGAVAASWSFPPGLACALLLTAAVYLRGFRHLRGLPRHFPPRRLAAFLGGLAALWIAIASPIDALAPFLLSTHMVQHLLLMLVAPPLLLLGAPLLPLLRGLPRSFVREGLAPFLAYPPLRAAGNFLVHPLTGWLAMTVAMAVWHLPGPYQIALGSPFWHGLEHATFFGASLLFWWPVVLPWPSRPQAPEWALPVYLLAGDLGNTALAAILIFSERLLYPAYGDVPRLFGLSAQEDQSLAGALMWVPGSIVFLVPAVVITWRLLQPPRLRRYSATQVSRAPAFWSSVTVQLRHLSGLRRTDGAQAGAHPGLSSGRGKGVSKGTSRSARNRIAGDQARFDLLRMPWLGAMLRAVRFRLAVQALFLLIAAVVVADGLFGHQMSAMNLAGVIPWTYARTIAVVALLAAFNLFCFGCPFTLPRALARRLGAATRRWPRRWRTKWVAALLLALFFWAYEVFGVWDRPRVTAWIIVAYFAASFAVDSFFRDASFCKYVCPIGQFQFLGSLVSPFEVKLLNPDACATCTTHDCVRGNEAQPGCPTGLYLPKKEGSLDCTFCMDCARACPRENVGLLTVLPAGTLSRDPVRSSLGRLSTRPDLAALALVFVSAAFVNPAAMIAPWASWRDGLAARLRLASTIPITTVVLLVTIVIAPPLLVAGAAGLGRRLARWQGSFRTLACRFALALVPVGAAMWASHFLFHLISGWDSAWPVAQRALSELGVTLLGPPRWEMSPALLAPNSLLKLELLVLDAGILLTLYAGWRAARDITTPRGRAALMALPFGALAAALYVLGTWVLLQPMEMRGMVH